jgi:hypothetical protein
MRALVACAVIAVLVAPRVAGARGKACVDKTAIVGRENCSRFGGWSRDSSRLGLTIDLGYEYRSFVRLPLADHELDATGGTLRVVDRLDSVFYAGGDVGVGGLASTAQTSYDEIHVILGARVVLFRLGLAVELAAGGGVAETETATDARFSVEARARAEWFVLPYVSVAVTYGHSIIDRDDQMMMVSLSVHTRVMDGSYSPL